jgi:putative ABC transport system permease protein
MVLASGMATFVMSLTALDSLTRARGDYFRSANFASVFATLKRAPRALEPRLRAIPGIADLETRIVVSAVLDVRGMTEPATALLVSVPDFSPPQVNRLHLRMGRMPTAERRGEVLVSEAFAAAHRLRPGDRLRAVINGRFQPLMIVGVALSPEFIYSVRGGEMIPDDRRFGVLWMPYRDLAAAFQMDGAFNDVAATLRPGASERDALRQLDTLLLPYGGGAAFGREHQASSRFLDNELIQLRGMALLPPAIFLSVTGFLLHIVLSRLVATQREQIATLRAFGYSRGAILRHYLAFAAILIALGAIVGTAAGAWLGRDLTELYARFFRFPTFTFRVDPAVVLLGTGLSSVAGFAAIWKVARQATAEPPAAAMQPAPPPRFRRSVVERLGLGRWLSPAMRMMFRHLELQPWRAAMTSCGAALSLAILVLGSFSEDMIDFVMRFQFEHAHRQDVTVTFTEPSPGRAVHDLRHLPGVLAVEPFRAAPVKLHFGHRSRRIALLGVCPGPRLFRVIDERMRPVEVPSAGVVLSAALAEALGCREGDRITIEVLDGARPVRTVSVAGVVRDFLDLNAYMDLDALRRLLREQETASGAFLRVDESRTDQLYAKLKALPRIASVGIRRAMLESYRRTLAENVLRMRAYNLFFACVVAIGVVYNAARVMLSERSRELATLRVLGFTRGETALMLLGELAVLIAASIPLGCLLGYGFAALLAWSLATEVHRFPLVVRGGTFAMATAVTIGAAIFAGSVVRQLLDRLDLIAVLKARD